MRLGTLEETVTVTGESPIVDVQSARRQTVLSNDVLKAIPTVRSYNAMVVVVPGVVTNTNDVQTGTSTTQFPIHGGRNNAGRMTVDGLNVGNPPGGNQPPGYSVDGRPCESETGGVVMNIVPKTGGNQIHGSFLYSGTGKKLQSDNSEGTNFERDPNPTHDLIKVTEQCSTGCAANGNRPGIVYRSQDWGQNYTGSYIWKANLAYVTGRHSFKVGYQHTLMTDERT